MSAATYPKPKPTMIDGTLNQSPDQDLHDALTGLRKAGLVAWDWTESRSL